jgi:uncharacterized membrane protein
MLNVFVPTTPNPTSSFYFLIAEDDMVRLRMTVDEAFKLIISGGMVTPPDRTADSLAASTIAADQMPHA